MDGSYINYQIDLKRFKKGKRINKGGFGTIYSIEEKETGKLFAAKVIDCGDDEEQCKKMIDREIGIMMHANHPTIIKLIGFSLQDFLEENNITIIMDLANKGSFLDILLQIGQGICPKDYTNTTRQIILVGIARGMKYLHDRNIMHRDIKAGNILIGDNYHPLITDFGMSKIFDIGHSKSQSQNGGTFSYMAPEVIKDCLYDRKADVYSFGILMYEIVTDSVAYPDLENGTIKEYEFKNKVANENLRPKFKTPIKRSIQNLIEQCWSNNPDERPTFNEIYKKLSNNNQNSNDEKVSEDNYLLDDIDIDQFNDYIEEIAKESSPFEEILIKKNEIYEEKNQSLERHVFDLQKEKQKLTDQLNEQIEISKNGNNELLNNLQYQNKIMKDTVSFAAFNSFPMKMQQMILDDYITNSKDQKISQFLTNVNALLLYMLNLEPNDQSFIQLFSNENDNQQLLTKIEEDKTDLILTLDAIALLITKNSFDSDDFINIITKIKSVIFKIRYPSETFQKINAFIDNINEKSKKDCININFSISVCITEMNNILQGNKNIIEAIVESPINIIGNCCFCSCSKLERVTLPDSINIIGYNAFEDCTSLKSINLPSSLIIIQSDAFKSCSELTEIKIPFPVKELGERCFQKCSKLKVVSLPASLKTISSSLFEDCCSLESIEIPSTIETIQKKAFANCPLDFIEIPYSVVDIQSEAFTNCQYLKQIYFRETSKVKNIGDNAFSRCIRLTSVEIPFSVDYIGDYCFGSCYNLYYAIVPPDLRMGYGAFTDRVTCFTK